MVLRNPSVEIGVIIFIAVYLAVGRIRGRHFERYQAWALAGAMLVLILALDGPVDALEDARLFTAHMVQHLLLALVVPPLLLLGTPDWILRPLVKLPVLRTIARVWVHPVVAYMIYNLVLVGMHSPRVFDHMCRGEYFHIAMHLLLLITAVPLWWPLLSPLPELPRLSYPAQLLYLFFWLIPMAAVAAPISLASSVIYPWYLKGPHPFGVSPLDDQVIGGLTMWIGAGFYMVGVFTTFFVLWVQREGDPPMHWRVPPASRRPLGTQSGR